MKISIINETWRTITLASFMVCILLVFCFHCATNNINHSTFQTANISIQPLQDSIASINDTEKPPLSNKCTATSIATEKPATSNDSITLIHSEKPPVPTNEPFSTISDDIQKPPLSNNSIIPFIDSEKPAASNESITLIDTEKVVPANEPIFDFDAEKPALAFNESVVISINDTDQKSAAANKATDAEKPALFNESIITSKTDQKPASSNESITSIDTQIAAPANESIISISTENPAPVDDLNIETEEPAVEEEDEEECNIFDGKWVYNPEKSPLYGVSQCPFLGDQVSCQLYGRPDREYEKWIWEAEECDIPRFNATDMLERLKNKRVIIVGDSINRNQWESLACLLYSAIPTSRAYVDVKSSTYKVFKAMDYQCSVEFYWSPFLVQLLEPDRVTGRKILKLDKLAKSARKWRGANVMLFNTGPWWVQPLRMRKWDVFQVRRKVMDNMELELAFERALKTWSNWVDRYVDTAKTQVFFRSMSAEHYKPEHYCYKQTQPILMDEHKKAAKLPQKIIEIVERTIGGMKTPVKYLNITKLSQYRIDGHPTIYTKKKQLMLTKHEIQPEIDSDCSHWCLPGVPDTWNTLLYASLV